MKWAKSARKRPKFGSKVAEISETLWPNARNSEKNFWQHCFHGNFITHIGVRGPECQSQLCMSLSGLTLAFGPGTLIDFISRAFFVNKAVTELL